MVSQRPDVDRYLQDLGKGLAPLPASERDDILREWTGHIEDLLASGESPEAVLARLGKPADVAAAMVEERLVTVDQRRSSQDVLRIVLRAALMPFLGTVLVMVAVMMANQVYLYADWLRAHKTDMATVLQVYLMGLPAVIEISVPTALLFVGLLGIPSLAQTLSVPLFRRIAPAMIKATLAAGIGVSLLTFVFQDTVVARANRETVRLQSQILDPRTLRPPLSPQEMSLSEARQAYDDWHRRQLHDTVRPNPFGWATRDKQWRYDIALKSALPATCAAMAALGLALGFALARRRPITGFLRSALGVGTVTTTYAVLSLGRAAAGTGGANPEFAAWLPVVGTLALAGLIAGTTHLARRQEDDHAAS